MRTQEDELRTTLRTLGVEQERAFSMEDGDLDWLAWHVAAQFSWHPLSPDALRLIQEILDGRN